MAPINYQIKNIENVLTVDGEIRNCKITRLTAPGENFLSLVLRVDVDVQKNGKFRTVNVVAKCLPLNKPNSQFNFNAVAMRNEIKWYSEIVQILKGFQQECGIEEVADVFPKYYGSRLSSNPANDEADSDAVLLLENLILQGYKNEDRHLGFDLATTKAILKSLAVFHAVPIALKVKKPEVFKIIKDYLLSARPTGGPKGPPDGDGGPPKDFHPLKLMLEAIDDIPECAPYMTKLRPICEKPPRMPGSDHEPNEPWDTITHGDFWVNNIMIKPAEGKEPLVKFVDFQVCGYTSYASDAIFLLLTSVRNEVQKENFDELVRYYYDKFTETLKQLKVDLELTYDEYLAELQRVTKKSEFERALFFSNIVFGEKNAAVDVAVDGFDPVEYMNYMIKNMKQHQKDKLVIMASETVKRNWI